VYLKSLEVQGFKSFPDKTVIRFGDDITAIVGPNGSGKSNISDAILWVMGEQSTKTLRGAKMEDVIFGGTQKRAAVGFAEATLTLDNTDRALPYDADEVMVTRRFYRSGDSEYYINRQSARLRDIHEMFMDTGLGREGYSNIGQGRIDEILSLKSADRREIFEEAAGISRFRHRKEETERKLQHTEDNLLRIGDKVSELELQLDPLKEQSEKAKRYLELKDELQGVEVAVWMDTLDKLSGAAQKAQEDYNSANFVLHQAQEDLDGLYAKSEALGQALIQKDGELETARVNVNMVEASRQQLDGQMAVIRGSIQNNEGNMDRIRQEIQAQEDRGGVTAQLEQARQRVTDADEDLGKLEAAENTSRRELADMTANAQGITRQFLELRGEETKLTANEAAASTQIQTLEESVRQNGQRAAELRSTLGDGSFREQEEKDNLARCRKELTKARDEVVAAKNTIAGYTLRLKTRAQRRDELKENLRRIRLEEDGVQTKLRVYRGMERDYEHYHKAVRVIMQEAQRGTLRNIHGPVSRIIRTADEYTLALEVALGGALQNIVVSTEADGKAGIQYLSRTKAGRVTFLPMSVIRGRRLQETGLEGCRGFVGIASDLVSFDEPYRGIVENLLGRTVIARDMDSALAMAGKYGHRFKIVTLDGQVLNPGGSMTGGSASPDAGMLSRVNELEKLEADAKRLAQRREEADKQYQEANRLAQQVDFQITAANDQLRAAEDRVLTLQGEEKQHEILLNAVQEAQRNSERELRELGERNAAEQKRLQELREEQKEYARQLAQTRDVLALLESSQTEAGEKLARIQAAIAELETQKAARAAEKAAALAHIADLENLAEQMAGDVLKKQALIESLREDNLRLEGQLKDLEKQQKEAEAKTAAMRRKLEEILAKRAEIEANRTRTDREAQEKNKDILTMGRACALLEQKKITTAMEEKQIVDKLWDSYGLTPGTAQDKRGHIESVAAGNRRIGELRRKIAALGTPNLGAIEEYARVSQRYEYLCAQRDDVLTSKRELESIIRDLTQEMTVIFVREFKKIDEYFGQTFQEMFGGGKAQLLLEDPQEPLTCGIEIRVQPPGKQVKTITLLSGGEKAFVAIALYFAILKVRPTPFCMLDEIDAALDDRNVERFASYLRSLGQKTQFIVITHRRGTMEASDVLYGVTMQEQGISKLLRLDLNQMEEYLGILK